VEPLDPATPRVAVMTFNVNFALAGDANTVAAVAQQDADVIFLQETTPQWEQALQTQFGASFPHVAFKHSAGAGGLGVMSKLPIERVDYLPAKDWFPAARVVLATPVGRLQVLNVHLRPPISNSGSAVSGYLTTPPVREQEIATFAAALDKNLPTLIVGDFNENERGRAVRWLRANGYQSALPQFQPKAQTWRWQTRYLKLNGRYDHLCYDARLTPLRVEVRNVGRSDHLPVVGVFALAAPAGDDAEKPH
jgi:endonuclease/exonuclease/phosphatase (EEP) superfamily protein YafD